MKVAEFEAYLAELAEVAAISRAKGGMKMKNRAAVDLVVRLFGAELVKVVKL